ncbi:unnamed protein product, partial [Protopolystoma xenopodis]
MLILTITSSNTTSSIFDGISPRGSACLNSIQELLPKTTSAPVAGVFCSLGCALRKRRHRTKTDTQCTHDDRETRTHRHSPWEAQQPIGVIDTGTCTRPGNRANLSSCRGNKIPCVYARRRSVGNDCRQMWMAEIGKDKKGIAAFPLGLVDHTSVSCRRRYRLPGGRAGDRDLHKWRAVGRLGRLARCLDCSGIRRRLSRAQLDAKRLGLVRLGSSSSRSMAAPFSCLTGLVELSLSSQVELGSTRPSLV